MSGHLCPNAECARSHIKGWNDCTGFEGNTMGLLDHDHRVDKLKIALEEEIGYQDRLANGAQQGTHIVVRDALQRIYDNTFGPLNETSDGGPFPRRTHMPGTRYD